MRCPRKPVHHTLKTCHGEKLQKWQVSSSWNFDADGYRLELTETCPFPNANFFGALNVGCPFVEHQKLWEAGRHCAWKSFFGKGSPQNSLYSRVSIIFVEATCSQILLGLFFSLNGILTGKACNMNETLLLPGVLNPASNGRVTWNSLTNGVADVTMDVPGKLLVVKSTYSLTMPGSWHLPWWHDLWWGMYIHSMLYILDICFLFFCDFYIDVSD